MSAKVNTKQSPKATQKPSRKAHPLPKRQNARDVSHVAVPEKKEETDGVLRQITGALRKANRPLHATGFIYVSCSARTLNIDDQSVKEYNYPRRGRGIVLTDEQLTAVSDYLKITDLQFNKTQMNVKQLDIATWRCLKKNGSPKEAQALVFFKCDAASVSARDPTKVGDYKAPICGKVVLINETQAMHITELVNQNLTFAKLPIMHDEEKNDDEMIVADEEKHEEEEVADLAEDEELKKAMQDVETA